MAETLKVLITGDAKNAEEAFRQAEDAAKQTMLGIAAAASAAAGSLGLLGKAVISTGSDFEQYRIRMEHLLGSQKEGQKVFEDMKTLATQIPFEFKDTMESATQLAGAVHGGANEIKRLMPMIADLAAVSGLGIRETTNQVVMMLSSGAAAADTFRQRGILSMLGFQAGVTYSADYTKKHLMEAWTEADSKFRGTAAELAHTWEGEMSMLGDRWTIFKNDIADDGAFNAAKGALQGILDELKNNKKLTDELAHSLSDTLVGGMESAITVVSLGAKSFYAMKVPIDAVRQEIDDLSLVGVEGLDKLMSAFQYMEELGSHLPGVGDAFQHDADRIKAVRDQLRFLEQGIKETGGKDTKQLIDDWDQVGKKFDEIDAKAQTLVNAIQNGAAKGAEATKVKVADTHGHGGTDPITGQAANLTQQQLQQRLKTIEQSLRTEQEKIQFSYASRSAMVTHAVQDHLILAERGHQLELKLEEQRNKALHALDVQLYQNRLALASGAMGALSSILASGGKKAFEESKAFSTAQTLISTYAAAQKAYESQMAIPTPDAPIRAAIAAGEAVAQGVARVMAISHTQYGGSGGAVAGGGGGSTIPTTPGQQANYSGYGQAQPITGSQDQKPEHVYYLQLPADPNQGISRAQAKYVADMQAKDKQDGIVSRLVMTG